MGEFDVHGELAWVGIQHPAFQMHFEKRPQIFEQVRAGRDVHSQFDFACPLLAIRFRPQMATVDQIRAAFPTLASLPESVAFPGPVHQTEYLSGGVLRTWEGARHNVISPVCLLNGEEAEPALIGTTPEMDPQAALAVLGEAVRAYDLGRGKWPTMSVRQRIKHVEDFGVRMKEKRAEVVKFIMWEIGKSREDAQKEFDRTVDYVRDTIQALKELDRTSSRFEIEQGIIGQIRRCPLGVVLCMGPYNYPLNETFATLIPALVMGNTCILKPPKLGVLLYRPLLEAFRDAFPPGVVNTVYGQGNTIISPMLETGSIDVLAFIGSSRVADTLKKAHPHPHKMRSVLGLGAKNPAIVLKDADLDSAMPEAVSGALSYNGQRCTALKIFYVHADIHNEFVARMSKSISELKFGMPWTEGVKLTPLPVPGKAEYLDELIKDAVSKGAVVANPEGGTFYKTFFYPALLTGVNESMRIYHEEQFGPVVPVVQYTDLDQAMNYVYNSHYGQQLSIFGSDPAVIAGMIDPLVNQVSRVNLNSQCQRGPDMFPFTGRKGSAEGTLSVTDALRAFSIRSLFAAKDSAQNKAIIETILRDDTSNFVSTDFLF